MKLQVFFDYLPHCRPCLACCHGENLFLDEKESIAFGSEKKDGPCVHLAEDGRCNIHASRPMECRLYPLDVKRVNGVLTWLLWTSCPATPSATADFYEQEMTNFEAELSLAWLKAYVAHHELAEPEKYSGMISLPLRPVKLD